MVSSSSGLVSHPHLQFYPSWRQCINQSLELSWFKLMLTNHQGSHLRRAISLVLNAGFKIHNENGQLFDRYVYTLLRIGA
jgi:hypothetical protein